MRRNDPSDPGHIDFLAADHDGFRARVRGLLDSLVRPNAEDWESERRISRSGWRTLGEAGLLSLEHSGPGFLHSAIFLEELGGLGYGGIRASVAVHAYMATSYLHLFGTEEQRQRYLPGARQGRLIAALALTESTAGSDLRDLGTRAHPTEHGYRVTGEKLYVANGSRADFIITLATSSPTRHGNGLSGASLLVVDADAAGVSRHPEPMLGWHSADVCRVRFTDVDVTADQLVGRSERALLHLVQALDFERLVAGMLAVGGVGHCLTLLRAFVGEHRVKGVPLGTHQAVRHRIAELESSYELVRHYGYRAAWLQANGRLDTRTASVLKLRATELAVTAAQTCLQFHGARGYAADAVAARLYRDAIAGPIAGGASELLRDLVYETT
ncbi:acyl-CoA dehydrogenase family protein [Streptomyces sp. NBC_01622]|uniref:acyl-CoA dehydrogenase family protein n=1 Tax=Streptomyces sp. NBC_01622 TaxID=2975903 RepID=UPI003868DB63|nr:acyl-CoA dehydrogenase family protein [Streptomyces sp. NBC_01622]